MTRNTSDRVFNLKSQGLSNAAIARNIGVSVATVAYHLKKKKTGTTKRPLKKAFRTSPEARVGISAATFIVPLKVTLSY